MGIHENKIKAIHNRNDLTFDEKTIQTYEVKGQAYNGVKKELINCPWIDEGITINITSLHIDNKQRVIIECEAWKNGKKLGLDLPFIYINPPLLGEGESLLQVARHMVASTVKANN